MIKCINHGFRSDRHCQCSQPRCTLLVYAGLLCCDACVSLELHTVTHFKLKVPPLQKSLIHIMNTARKRTAYEMSNFIDIFQVNFGEVKRPNFKTLYLSFCCEFQAISNARLKSRICSDRLQNFIFVQWELAPDEAVKWSDPFHDSEKKWCHGVCTGGWG